ELLNGIDDDCDFLADEGLGLNFYSNGISIYPNPTTGFLSIELNDLKTGVFELYSSSGSLMEIGDISSKITIIDLQSVPAGIYHLIYKTDTEYSVFRIVKVIE
ncbi:MAG TPA: T9SS type A sorting domain-containing protein, partial [Chitinophagales bacterium]|nr:T9SS type A sorting domain-containing protein [Chitinophagales bacterium]HNM09295.1 T9SS type A sorting domain-containing protein [Chitinophagales bacterium]HNM30676.1 T9SS type A sorting domain-containing protein [Chitinophagales bacterium]